MDNIDLYPPDLRDKMKEENVDARKMILFTIQDKKVTWPSEIETLTGLSNKTIFRNLNKLVFEKIVKRVTLKRHTDIPKFIKERIPEFWERGEYGGKIRNHVFYMICDDKALEVEKALKDSFLD